MIRSVFTPFLAAALVLGLAAPAMTGAAMAAPAKNSGGLKPVPGLSDRVAADYREKLGPLFTDLHQNPELSWKETRTSGILAKNLRDLGFEVTTNVGGTGIVAIARNGAGPVVLIRADMDALPVEERSGLFYASKARQIDIEGVERPVMHACGHDAHVAALVGTARQLMELKQDWRGTLVLIGQPAEERIGGAKRMLEDGLYSRFPKPDYALALHVNSLLPLGQIKVEEGLAYSSSDSVDIRVRGIGAHGAAPHKGVDPVLIASQIVVSLQSLVARSINPLEPGVVTVGSIHGGTKHNIIPEEVNLQLTVRADNRETRDQLLAGITRIAEGTARALGVPENLLPVVKATGESTPPTANDPETARRVRRAFVAAFGETRLDDTPRQGMGAEDFAYFITPESGVKGVYFNVGGTPREELPRAASHHSPLFRITPEETIRTGVEAMTVAALDILAPARKK